MNTADPRGGCKLQLDHSIEDSKLGLEIGGLSEIAFEESSDGGWVVPPTDDPDDDGFRPTCEGMDGPFLCSKPVGHSGPHYFFNPWNG